MINKTLILKCGLCISLLLQATQAFAGWNFIEYGLDYKYRWLEGAERKGYDFREALPKGYHGVAGYLGFNFSRNFSSELGIEQSFSENKQHTFRAGEIFINSPQQANDLTIIKSRTHALYLDFMPKLLLNNTTTSFLKVGGGLMRAKIRGTLGRGTQVFDLAPSGSYRLIPRIGAGLSYRWNWFTVRPVAMWEATNFMAVKMTDELGVRTKIRPFKSSFVFSIGIGFGGNPN